MNLQYEQLRVKEGEYIPQPAMDYPQDNPFARTLFPKYTKQLAIDDKYPYLNDSVGYKFNLYLGYYVFLHLLLRIKLRVQMGLRIRGREVLKKHKEGLKNGAITIANHVYRLDCPCVLIAVNRTHNTRIPMFAPNFRTKDGYFMGIAGGIPIPEAEAGMSAMKKFNEAFDEFHRRGWWFHIFPEACRWDMYKPLRPFQKGAFTMSYKYNKPLLPCVITYRERKGIFRLFGPKELPLLTVTIGEPIYPDTTQARKTEVERLRNVAHAQMQQMAGITHNPWPAAWENQ
ncbi:MAG: 1-acyl-sn-glycerol-3-phosphate acyltransferase [Paludibacteraceae bacterium]|nr:1-acyl-sn-glycerol-3-phosphate acyltransferase [Paludibacteraceae bacterium]MBO5013875.1 1-acyl-sn-glycerol-3-phosphate acyltransferase [Paludibacteraceae bacterium]